MKSTTRILTLEEALKIGQLMSSKAENIEKWSHSDLYKEGKRKYSEGLDITFERINHSEGYSYIPVLTVIAVGGSDGDKNKFECKEYYAYITLHQENPESYVASRKEYRVSTDAAKGLIKNATRNIQTTDNFGDWQGVPKSLIKILKDYKFTELVKDKLKVKSENTAQGGD